MRTITTLSLFALFLVACAEPLPASEPLLEPACSDDVGTVLATSEIGWTATYPATFGATSDLFVGELEASGARGDFRVYAFAGYDSRVSLTVTCSSGLAHCFGVGPDYSEETGGASVDGSSCLASETTMAWAVVGCEDPTAAVTVEVEVERRRGHEDACAYQLAVSVIPETI